MNGAYSKLRRIQQVLENQVDIVRELLCTELCESMKYNDTCINNYFFMVVAMDLCSCYLDSIDELLKGSNKQVNMELVFLHFSKIKKVFDVISDSAEIRELPDALNGTIHVFCDYLNQVDNIKGQLEKFISRQADSRNKV